MPITARNRCFRVEIETPPDDSAKVISYHREGVLEDSGVEIGRAKVQPRPLRLPFVPTLATQVRTVFDPVLGVEVTLSGAGLAAWITADFDERNTATAPEPKP
jgi:hypothetical protein